MEKSQTVTRPIIEAARLCLRKARPGDLDALVEIQTDRKVRRYLGGPRPEPDVRAALMMTQGVEATTADPGAYVIAATADDDVLGLCYLDRRGEDRPGHVTPSGGELELSYVLRQTAWGNGYATEACRALLSAAAQDMDDQAVIIVTQTENAAATAVAHRLGFTEVDRFEEFGAEQLLAVARLCDFATG